MSSGSTPAICCLRKKHISECVAHDHSQVKELGSAELESISQRLSKQDVIALELRKSQLATSLLSSLPRGPTLPPKQIDELIQRLERPKEEPPDNILQPWRTKWGGQYGYGYQNREAPNSSFGWPSPPLGGTYVNEDPEATAERMHRGEKWMPQEALGRPEKIFPRDYLIREPLRPGGTHD
uniref:Uncharacterized protein n=1 Tax=Cyanoptyche gloeocystis TaxID=77922 RepID=A0A7S2JML1_9EUKA|mmetsp:Transcript_2612/g.4754  ORF Transcript_2612/g.4754 Transcript_2612/m.4754 type:complete len:181 (+) Transcript_2612:18-560(+)|eukprot:CAMPEP_0196658882 /NCGR_PEP_ID=MMETSP1086-20130531/32115_1 /TAXON_ID=77921 /ORGANISM="Cyanoptyche  gloeocystis , Strain SAG4.97" /LENGTH=180 /DNA_ID=CAMNT_0041992659 /DNA_START=18 /DNA_END=560 /DNA_ORIENTATION=+